MNNHTELWGIYGTKAACRSAGRAEMGRLGVVGYGCYREWGPSGNWDLYVTFMF